MRKVLYSLFTVIAAVCMTLGIVLMSGVSLAKAEAGITPTLSATKHIKSDDGAYMLLATGIADYADVYEVGYVLSEGLTELTAVTTKYYRSITVGQNARRWTASDIFNGAYDAMIVWEVEYDKYCDVSFQAYAKVGDREGGVLVESDTVAYATEKAVDIERTGYTTATKKSSVYPTLEGGQTVENWNASSQMIVFDYKWTTDNGDGNDYAQVQLWGTSNQLSGNLRLKYSNNQLDSYLGRTVALNNGWRQFRARLCDLPVNGDFGSETLTRIKISSEHRYDMLIDNIRVEAIKDSDTEIALDGTFSVANGNNYDIVLPDYDKNIIKTLEMDLDLTDAGTDKFYIGLYDETTHYYGGYRFQAGQMNTGYTMDGLYASVGKSGTANYKHYHIVFNLSELNGGSNTKPSKLFHIKNTATTTAGTISNVKFSTALPSLEIDSNTNWLYVSPTAVSSDKVLSFDVSIPSNGDLRYLLTDTASSVYFGTYRFYPAWKDYDGVSHENAVTAGARNGVGVTYSEIGTDLYHLEYDLSALSGGSGTAPTKIYAIYNNGTKNDTDGYNKITNIKWLDASNYSVTVTGGSGSGKYNNGDTATVVANDVAGKRFKEWQIGGAKVSESKTYSFTVTANTAIEAIFDDVYTVEVSGGYGAGTYLAGTEITVVANDRAESFIGWKNGSDVFVSGDSSYTFTVTADVSLTAVYGPLYLESGFDIRLPDYNVENTGITALEFDLYVTDARSPYTKIYWNLYDASDNYFGYYRITYGGIQATNTSGYSIESIGTDTFHVTLVLKDLAGGSGTPGKLVRLADSGASVNLDGAWIDNIRFTYATVPQNAVMSLDVPDNTAQVLKTASAPVSSETTVFFSGAKGERETAQLTMYATSNIVDKEFDVTFTDFVGENGTIPASAMETYMFGYINVNSNFFTDPNNYNLPLGEYPDWLLPLSVAKNAGENVLNVSSGNNQGLYFILNIPSFANKGTYYGNVIITVEDNSSLCLPVEIEVYGFALPEENAANVMMGIRNDMIAALYGNDYADNTNAMYAEIRSELTARGISTSEIPGSAYSSSTIDYYVTNLKAAAADPKVTVYRLSYNYDEWSSITVSGTAYNWNGSTTNLSNEELGLTRLPRVFDVTANTKTYYGLIGLFTKLADESTNDVDLFKKAVIVAPYDEHYGVNNEIQILLCKYATYYARDHVVASYDWTGKTGVRDSLADLRFIVASAPGSSLYTGDTIRVTSYDAPIYKEQTVDGSWMPTSSTLIKLDGFMTEIFDFQLSGITSVVTAQSVANSDAILASEANPATESDYLLYWYTPVGGDKTPHWASLSTNASVLNYRVNYWQQYKRGIDGMQYWSVSNTRSLIPSFTPTEDSKVQAGKSYYQANGSALYGYSRVYPAVGSSASGLYEYGYVSAYDTNAEHITEAYILENGTHFQGCYGEATLFYMVKDTYGAHGTNLLTTLRLENTAEAIDDYNYLAYAQSLIDGVQNASTKAAYQARFDALFNDLFDLTDGSGKTTTCGFKAAASDLKASRSALATLIEDLLA